MRNLMIVAVLLVAGGPALAAPFDPAVIPKRAEVVGHLDVDALRGTQLFAAVGGQAAIDKALDNALGKLPAAARPLVRGLTRSVRGISFWRDADHGAVQIDTSDDRVLRILPALLAKPAGTVNGIATYVIDVDDDGDGDGNVHAAVVGSTLVASDDVKSLERSLRVLTGKGPSLASANKLPMTNRQGVFVFVALGENMLNAIQQSAQSKMLQLALSSLVIDVGERSGQVTAFARAEMRTAEAVDKAKRILDGLQALATLTDEPQIRTLLQNVNVTANGSALEVSAKLPVAEIARTLQSLH